MAEKKKPENSKKTEKPNKPSILKTGAKFAAKNPVQVAATAVAAGLGSGFLTAVAAGKVANEAYKNRDKIKEAVNDPNKVKGAVNEGVTKIKGFFGKAAENINEGLKEGKTKEQNNEAPEAKKTGTGPKNEPKGPS
jgi:hypothetical protein